MAIVVEGEINLRLLAKALAPDIIKAILNAKEDKTEE